MIVQDKFIPIPDNQDQVENTTVIHLLYQITVHSDINIFYGYKLDNSKKKEY